MPYVKCSALALVLCITIVLATGCTSSGRSAGQQQQSIVQRNIALLHEQQRMLALRDQAQQRMLAALSAAHAQLLASIVGQLAVTRQPDVPAAAAQLDHALSVKEKQDILNVSHDLRRQFEAAVADLRPERGDRAGDAAPQVGQAPRGQEDAGMTLLLTVTNVTAVRTSMAAHSRATRHD